jgi:hypothetical protein
MVILYLFLFFNLLNVFVQSQRDALDRSFTFALTYVDGTIQKIVNHTVYFDRNRQQQSEEICQLYGVQYQQSCIRDLLCLMVKYDTETHDSCKKPFSRFLTDFVVTPHDTAIAAPEKQINERLHVYSSFRCIGGSQHIQNPDILRHSPKKFPKYDFKYRSCMFTNVCFMFDSEYPTMAFFRSPAMRPKQQSTDSASVQVPIEFTPAGFGVELLQLGALSDFSTSRVNKSFMPVHYVDEPLWRNQNNLDNGERDSESNSKQNGGTSTNSVSKRWRNPYIEPNLVAFLGSTSWANYGHYLIDHVFPTFVAAGLWNISVENVLQLLDNSCMQMALVNPNLPYNFDPSLTNHQYCLNLYTNLSRHFFDLPPVFLDSRAAEVSDKMMCFKRAILGQNSAFGAASQDLSRAHWLRQFRDLVVRRVGAGAKAAEAAEVTKEEEEEVNVRTSAESGGGATSTETGTSSKTPKKMIYVSYKMAGFSLANEARHQMNQRMCDTTSAALQSLVEYREEVHHIARGQSSGSDADGGSASIGGNRDTWTEDVADTAALAQEYYVVCGVVHNSSFEDEVRTAQEIDVLVTFEGTVSYTALFVRDNTEVIVIAQTKTADTYKENQYLMWATHFHASWIRIELFTVEYMAGVLLKAIYTKETFI